MNLITVGSVFSGIEGMGLGLEQAGMEVAWQCETNPFRRRVLERHYSGVRRYEDVRDIGDAELEPQEPEQQPGADSVEPDADHPPREQGEPPAGGSRTDAAERGPPPAVDLLCGGFPCQDLSTAGRRAGLQGERSVLFFEFVRLTRLLRPRWLLVENVPGLLSSPPTDKGADFDALREAFAELGYGLALRTLDSQHFGVPQRRRRLYVVGYLGAPCPPEVLFEPQGGGGPPAEGGKAGETVAHGPRASPRGVDEHTGTTYVIEDAGGKRSGGPEVGIGVREGGPGYTMLRGHQHAIAIRSAQPGSNGGGILEDSTTHALDGSQPGHIAVPLRGRSSRDGVSVPGRGGEDDYNLVAHQPPDTLLPDAMAVRRLTPLECERLQGFPDGWTCLCGSVTASEGCVCPDGPRYSALGDANTVPVVEWIGRRIAMAEAARCR